MSNVVRVTPNRKTVNVVNLDSNNVVRVTRAENKVVRVSSPGPRGPEGPPGIQGGAYEHEQSTPSTQWIINHTLDRIPGGILVVDNSGNGILGAISLTDVNTVQINFNTPLSGKAYLS